MSFLFLSLFALFSLTSEAIFCLLFFPVPFGHMCDMYQRIVTTYSHRLFVYNMYIIYMYLYIYIYNTFFRATESLFIPAVLRILCTRVIHICMFLYIPSVPSIPFLFLNDQLLNEFNLIFFL